MTGDYSDQADRDARNDHASTDVVSVRSARAGDGAGTARSAFTLSELRATASASGEHRQPCTGKLLIVIVNYRVPDLTIDCLRSLADERARGQEFEVTLVENSSGDDSAARFAAAIRDNAWNDWVTLKCLDHNGGFAAGNNAAIAPALASEAAPEFVLLLNPDTLVRPGAIGKLRDFAEQHPEVGIVGCRLEDLDGTPQRSAFRFPTVLGEFESTIRTGPVTKLLASSVIAPPLPSEQCRVDWVCGACMLVRNSVFTSIGLLDDAYFMYYEEVDFCHRALRAGWPCWFIPDASVVHLVGKSSGVFDPNRVRSPRPAYWFHSRRRYFRLNYGSVQSRLADVAWLIGLVLYRTRRAIDGRFDPDPTHLFRDFVKTSFAGKQP
jgi:N-acetylglucosaminyl-diphospho-decaprenol L-rhamnosyltransferase